MALYKNGKLSHLLYDHLWLFLVKLYCTHMIFAGDEGDHLRPVWQRPQQVRLLQAPRVPQRCCRQRQVRQISFEFRIIMQKVLNQRSQNWWQN